MHPLRIVVAGPQFGEPSVVMRWFAQRYDTHVFMKPVGDHDALLIVEGVEDGFPVIVAAPRMAAFEKKTVYEHLFARPDAVMLIFTRISAVGHLNRSEYEVLRPYLDANDIYERFVGACCDARSPAKPPTKRVVGRARSGVRGVPGEEVRKVPMGISVRPA